MEDHQDILSQIVTALREGLGESLVAVVLYGSRARGQARQASDWDLFIIASDLPKQLWERHILLKRFLPTAYRGAVSLLAKTPQEFEEKNFFLISGYGPRWSNSLCPTKICSPTFGRFAAPDGGDGPLS